MHAAADRPEFAPPPQAGLGRAMALALAAHLLLLLALTWGVSWKRDAENLSAQAELWSAVPQQAAPKLEEAPPPAPVPAARIAPPPKAAALPREADIALERENKRKAEAKARQDELERLKKIEQQKLEALKKQEAQKKQALAQKAEEEKRKLADAAQARQNSQAEEARRLEALRKENLDRMRGMAGATGAPDATGTALRASGPSASYRGRLAALFKRNITFANADSIQGNPRAIVQVKVSPAGLIMSSRLTKSSGVPAWDEAVLRAVEKTERIPLDENGRTVSDFPVEFGPRD